MDEDLLVNPNYRLFDFRCTLIKESEFNMKIINEIEYFKEIKINNNNLNMNDKLLKYTKDLSMIFSKFDKSDINYKLLLYIRKKCNIKEGKRKKNKCIIYKIKKK